jgi:arylformamidase
VHCQVQSHHAKAGRSATERRRTQLELVKVNAVGRERSEEMKFKSVFDLTQPLYHNCPCWPDLQPPTIERMLFIPKADANVETLSINTHTATHVDAPYHKLSDGKTLDQIPVNTWIGEGVVVDVSFLGDKDLITAKVLEESASHMVAGDIVMLYTGWGNHRGFSQKYLKDWPALDDSGAEWLINKRAKVVGTDALSVDLYDLPPDTGPVAHYILLGAGVPIVEELYLGEIAKMGNKRWTFFCLPISIKDTGGSPARVIAVE